MRPCGRAGLVALALESVRCNPGPSARNRMGRAQRRQLPNANRRHPIHPPARPRLQHAGQGRRGRPAVAPPALNLLLLSGSRAGGIGSFHVAASAAASHAGKLCWLYQAGQQRLESVNHVPPRRRERLLPLAARVEDHIYGPGRKKAGMRGRASASRDTFAFACTRSHGPGGGARMAQGRAVQRRMQRPSVATKGSHLNTVGTAHVS